MKNKYSQCLKEMYGLRRFGIKLGLETILDILSQLDHPHHKFSSIHIAGTNGKGSVAAMLSSILYHSGYCTGLYTSPHLIRFNERIKINNKEISNKNVVSRFNSVKKLDSKKRELTFFEYTTAMAFDEFVRQNVEWAVVETGMGGRLDATNVLYPNISLITNISLEHQMYLGKHLWEIAFEKAGIIKKFRPVITDVRQKHAYEVIKDIAESQSAPLYRLGDNIRVRKNKDNTINYYGLETNFKNIKIPLQGDHQVRNLGMVLACCEILVQRRTNITEESIIKGLKNINWPGRIEIISNNPLFILDGAHNLMAVKNLVNYLNKKISNKPLTLIIGILDDKPYKKMLNLLLPLAQKVILTTPKIERSLNIDKLYQYAKIYSNNILKITDVSEAIKYSLAKTPKNEAICVAGSLYLIGEAKACISDMTDQLFLA